MKNHFLNQRLLVNTWKTCLLTFLTWASPAQATPTSPGYTATSYTAGVPEKTSFRLTTRLSAIGSESEKVIEIASTPETVEVIERLNDSPVRKKKKKSGLVEGLPGLAGLPLPEEKREPDLYGGGYIDQDDDDSFKRPPYFPIQNKGDFTLTLLPVLRIPSDWRSYLPGNHWSHWVVGEPDHDSGVTLQIRFNDSSVSVIQLSQAEFRQLKAYLGNSKQLLQWLAPKLSGREAFIHLLLNMAAGLSEEDEGSRQQIEKQIDMLAEWADHEFSLEFEWEQLERTLAGSNSFKDMVVAHEPDTETIYEGDDINKLIHQAMFSWLWGSQKSTSTGATGSGKSGSYGQRGGRRTGRASDRGDNDERGSLLAQMRAVSLSTYPALRIVLVGQQDVGKSSLGNRLIGWKPFKVIPVFNEESDPIYRFGDLEIRALKGYGDFDHDADYFQGQFIEDQKIHPSDIVIFVFDKDLNGLDKGAIRALTKKGNRIIFVCNKIDTCSDKEADKEIIKERFKKNLIKLGFHETPELVFTCSIPEKQDELVPTKKLEDMILSALEKDKQRLFVHFIKSRIRPDEKFMTLIKEKIEKKVQDSDGQLPNLEEINSIITDTVVSYIKPKVLSEGITAGEFEEFKADFNKVVNKLKKIAPDEDREFFLRECNQISKSSGYSKKKSAEAGVATGTLLGGAVGTLFGPWGSLAGAALGGTLGGLIGIGGAMSVNYLFRDDLRIDLTAYRACRGGVQKALDERMKQEISKIFPQKVEVMKGGKRHYDDHPEIKKIKKRYCHIMDKFDPWVQELGKIITDATQTLRHLVEDQLAYYQLHYDRVYALTFESAPVSFVDFPEIYEEVPSQLISHQAIQQFQPVTIAPPSLPPAKPPHILQDHYRVITERDEVIKRQLSAINFTEQIKEAAQCSNWMKKGFPEIRTSLKNLWAYQTGKHESVETAVLHRHGYYNSVIFIPLLYAFGTPLEKIKLCNSSEQILNIIIEHGFSPIRETIVQQDVPETIKDERLLNTIELAVLMRNMPERIPVFLEGEDFLNIPEIVFQRLISPTQRPRQYSELMKATATLLHKTEQIQINQPLLEEMTVGQNAEVLQAPHAMDLQSIQVTQPVHGVSAALLQLAANTADWVFSMGKWMDKVTYESLLIHDPKRTRIHRIAFLAEPLYGIHLRNVDLFDEHIGDMTEPAIVAVNGYGNTDIWHAFLLFRNSKNGEFNTFHIRQGCYYPEYMDKEATLKYFRAEKKQLKGVLSVNALSVLYGREADLGGLREIYSQLFGKIWNYKMKDNNCMTFSMLALDATPLNRESLLNSTSPQGVHSPYHIMKALRESKEKDHSAAMHNSLTNNLGLPDWLINPVQL